MSKVVKSLMMEDIRRQLGECRDMLVLNTSKLDGVTDNKLRLSLQKKGIQLVQVKNSLARRALADAGKASLDHVLAGPSTIVWGGEDIVALSKEIAQWARQIKELEVKGGTADGQPIDAQGFESLSKSPGRQELLGQIAGLILSPGARLAGALLGAGGTLAGQVKAIADKEGDGPSAE